MDTKTTAAGNDDTVRDARTGAGQGVVRVSRIGCGRIGEDISLHRKIWAEPAGAAAENW